MRLRVERCRNSLLRKSWKVSALKMSQNMRTKVPVAKFTAPKQATDLRVGACCSTGSLISGGPHIRQREPCCWKWHSSRLHSSTPGQLARWRSFFYRRDFERIRLGYLRARLTQPKAHLPKHPLALAHPQIQAVVPAQMLGEQRSVPQIGLQPQGSRRATQFPLEFAPLSRLQPARPAAALPFAQAFQSALVKSTDSALHRRRILAEQQTDLPTRLTGCDQQQPVQTMIVAGLIIPVDLLLDRQSHHLTILNLQLAHRHPPKERRCNDITMMQYLCRRV